MKGKDNRRKFCRSLGNGLLGGTSAVVYMTLFKELD